MAVGVRFALSRRPRTVQALDVERVARGALLIRREEEREAHGLVHSRGARAVRAVPTAATMVTAEDVTFGAD